MHNGVSGGWEIRWPLTNGGVLYTCIIKINLFFADIIMTICVSCVVKYLWLCTARLDAVTHCGEKH